MIWLRALQGQGRLVRITPMWIRIVQNQDTLVFQVIAEPIPALQACRESRTVALEHYAKLECEQACLSFIEDYEYEEVQRCQDLGGPSTTYTYINWVTDIVFLESGVCSFDEVMYLFGNSLEKAQHLLLDYRFRYFCDDIAQLSSQLRIAFNEAKQIAWVTPRRDLESGEFESWELRGPLTLRVRPAAQPEAFDAMCSQISIKCDIRKVERSDGRIEEEADVDAGDTRCWPLWKGVRS